MINAIAFVKYIKLYINSFLKIIKLYIDIFELISIFLKFLLKYFLILIGFFRYFDLI